MTGQNYANHARLVTGFHKILYPVLFASWLGSGVNLWQSWGDHNRFYSAALLFVLIFAVMALGIYARVFALRAQDRAIRAEENLRHFVMTGQLLDARLRPKQIVALRFAGDDEFVELARKAAAESIEPDSIKQAIRNWRADHHRV